MVVAGRYEVDLGAPLGAGGMAVIYRGRDLRTRRAVAVRTLRTEYRTNPASRAAFRQETRNQALANHGNIARIYDLHEEQDAPWAVMELVPGPTLREMLTQHGPYPATDVADLLDQVASALAHLHGRGMVHLDVKPENLLVVADGTVKLIDFGLAQPLGRAAEPIGGAAFGTAAYLSPEQITGDPVDVASDVYTLACVTYELLTGQPPFGGVPPGAPNPAQARSAILRAHLDTAPAPPSLIRPDLEIPPAVDDVVLWALAKRPDERYTDVTAFARLFRGALEPFAATQATTTPIAYPSASSAPTDTVPSQIPATAQPGMQWRDLPTATQQPWARPATSPASSYPAGGNGAQPAGSDATAYPEAPAMPRAQRQPLRRVRRFLWRLFLVFLFANIVLFGTLILVRGADQVLPFQPAIERNIAVENVDGDINLRQGPSLDDQAIATIQDNSRLTVTGDAVRDTSGKLWWPVTTPVGDGYVRADGIRAVPRHWYERWSVNASDAIDGALDPVRNAIPGL